MWHLSKDLRMLSADPLICGCCLQILCINQHPTNVKKIQKKWNRSGARRLCTVWRIEVEVINYSAMSITDGTGFTTSVGWALILFQSNFWQLWRIRGKGSILWFEDLWSVGSGSCSFFWGSCPLLHVQCVDNTFFFYNRTRAVNARLK